MTNLKEKDIIRYVVNNWDRFFPEIDFYKTEFSFRDFRVDIAAKLDMSFEDLGQPAKPWGLQAPIFFEVKYNSEMRDLLFELQKQISFRNWYINVAKSYCMVCVISDKFDGHMVKYMMDNDIPMFKINIENDNLENMTIVEYKPNYRGEVEKYE